MNDGDDWIVDIDLEKFFDTVNYDKLMSLIGRTIKDGDVISIIRKFLVSGIMVDDEYKESVIGTPQGGNLSPLLANIMLNELDKEMEQRGLKFVRYADDCIIMVGSEMSAKRVMRNSNIRYRLRMCIWKHWKTSHNRAKNLMKLGISRKFAWSTAYYGAHIAYVCQGGAMNMAVTKERLTRFGLVLMLDYYTERCV